MSFNILINISITCNLLGNVGLLPFTPLMRPPTGTTPKAWVERYIETTKAAPVDSRTRGTLLYALSVFVGLIHPPEFFQDGKLEAIMQESPVYEAVIQRGRQEGRINEKRTDVLKIVQHRFTEKSDTVLNANTDIDDLVRLDELFDQVLTAETFEYIDFSKNGK